jgi:hypothetical protein
VDALQNEKWAEISDSTFALTIFPKAGNVVRVFFDWPDM